MGPQPQDRKERRHWLLPNKNGNKIVLVSQPHTRRKNKQKMTECHMCACLASRAEHLGCCCPAAVGCWLMSDDATAEQPPLTHGLIHASCIVSEPGFWDSFPVHTDLLPHAQFRHLPRPGAPKQDATSPQVSHSLTQQQVRRRTRGPKPTGAAGYKGVPNVRQPREHHHDKRQQRLRCRRRRRRRRKR